MAKIDSEKEVRTTRMCKSLSNGQSLELETANGTIKITRQGSDLQIEAPETVRIR